MTRISAGLSPFYSGEELKPELILVYFYPHYPQSALFTEASINVAIKAAKRQVEPEFNVTGRVKLIHDGIGVLFIITEPIRVFAGNFPIPEQHENILGAM